LIKFDSRDAFIDVCWKRKLACQVEEDGEILAFVGDEFMGRFGGTEGFLLEETMVKHETKKIYIQYKLRSTPLRNCHAQLHDNIFSNSVGFGRFRLASKLKY